mmetsp:Transcript_9484/g.29475  ORF Transcript_9484/g.29475 Transcript_9484/m.29475 type:complete len:201 (-) Transcript_9484:2353-2955(-)
MQHLTQQDGGRRRRCRLRGGRLVCSWNSRSHGRHLSSQRRGRGRGLGLGLGRGRGRCLSERGRSRRWGRRLGCRWGASLRRRDQHRRPPWRRSPACQSCPALSSFCPCRRSSSCCSCRSGPARTCRSHRAPMQPCLAPKGEAGPYRRRSLCRRRSPSCWGWTECWCWSRAVASRRPRTADSRPPPRRSGFCRRTWPSSGR